MTGKPHMFSRIFDFAYERTALQAFGFYLCHLIIYTLLVGAVLGFLQAGGVLKGTDEEQLRIIMQISPPLSLSYSLATVALMLKAKNLASSLNHVLLGALGVALGAFGVVFSLIAIAWMSTRPVAAKLGSM